MKLIGKTYMESKIEFVEKEINGIIFKTRIRSSVPQDLEDRKHCTSRYTLSPEDHSRAVSVAYLRPLVPKLCELCENFIR